MIEITSEHFVHMENIDFVSDLCLNTKIESLKQQFPGKKFYISAVAQIEGSDTFFKELAYLESNRQGLDMNIVTVDAKEVQLRSLFTHPAAVVYHPEFDSFTLNFYTHAKVIKSTGIETQIISNKDFIGQDRDQCLAKNSIQIPREIMLEFVNKDDLIFNFKLKNNKLNIEVNMLEYLQTQTALDEIKNVIRNNLQMIRESAPYLEKGYFKTTAPELNQESSPFKIYESQDTDTILINYKKTESNYSYILIKSLEKKVSLLKNTKTIAKCKCIIF